MKHLNRRTFLISSLAGASTLIFANKAFTSQKEAIDLLNPASPLVLPPNFVPSVWFTMESNGRTTVHIFKSEMGQHIGTSLAQIVAEELCLSWKDVTIDYPQMDHETLAKYGMQMTGGSWSVVSEFEKLSKVSAAARQIIIEAGAELLGADLADCVAEKSVVKDTLMGEKISYSEILSETVIDYQVNDDDLSNVKMKDKADYQIIGKSVVSLDVPEKINGSARYAIDAQVPNMIYAKIIPPPKRMGAKIVSVDDTKAKNVKGYIQTIPFNFPEESMAFGAITHIPLVIASNFPSAMRAAKLIDIEWDTSSCSSASSEEFEVEATKLLNDKNKGILSWQVGDYDTCENGKECKKIERSYKTSMVAHVPLEPMSTLANFDNGFLHIYAGHQVGSLLPSTIGQVVGIEPDKIIYHPHLIGGSFGKRTEFGMLLLACIATVNLKKPIKLILTREDDMAFSHPRTPTVQNLEAKVIGKSCLGYKQEIASATMQFDKLMPDFLRNPIVDGQQVDSEKKVEGFTVVGSENWYDIENQTVKYYRQRSIENSIPVRNVRSVGNNYTVFATETFIDEVSQDMEVDPMTFRLNYLNGVGLNAGSNTPSSQGGGKRLANVLRIASGLANYGVGNLSDGEGLGIAVTGAENRFAPCFTALIAKVNVDRNSAAIDVQKLTCVLDVGIAINPDGIKAQVEGSLLWGLSNALFEKMTLDDGVVSERNFDSYKWQNITKLPELEIHIVENGPFPSGVGEPATCVVAPAIGNAIFNATGVRLRSLPFSREELFEGLEKVST